MDNYTFGKPTQLSLLGTHAKAQPVGCIRVNGSDEFILTTLLLNFYFPITLHHQ